MTLNEYLQGKDKKAFAKEIGVGISAIYRYLNGRTPKAPIPLRIEKATKGMVKAKQYNRY